MQPSIPKTTKCLIFAFFLFISGIASAQSTYNNIIFTVDSLFEVGLPKSALKEVDVLYGMAHKENNAPQIVRSVIYRLKFQTYLQDDALVSIINSLKSDIANADYPVKPVLQSLLAQMYWNYYTDNRDKFASRTRLEKPDIDFRNWDLATLTDEVTRLYVLSMNDAKLEQNTPVGVLDGILIGDKGSRYLRPTLYDLLLHRSFDYFLAEEPAITQPKNPFSMNQAVYFGDNKVFAALNISAADTNSTIYRGVKFLQQGIAFHLIHHNSRALADLDLERLEFVYRQSTLADKDKLYVTALAGIASDTSAGQLRGDALYAIGSHYEDTDSLVAAMVYLRQAVKEFPKSIGGIASSNRINQIMVKSLSAMVEDINAPHKPVLASIAYRNVIAAQYRIYRLTDAQLTAFAKLDSYKGRLKLLQRQVSFLKKLKAVQNVVLQLPVTTDYREHSTEFKIDPLETGSYVLLLQQGNSKNSLLQLTTFKVSGLAYLIRSRADGKKEIKITDRETGAAIAGAKVKITFEAAGSRQTKPAPVNGITDGGGMFVFAKKSNSYIVSVINKEDFVSAPARYDYSSDMVYTEKDSASVTLLFTDRQIYRPGQTIYFKALQTQRSGGKSKIVPGADIAVTLKDRNNQVQLTVNLKTNEFGSASSAFVLPQNILNGYMILETKGGRAMVRVEEYKRPTFKTIFEPVTRNYKIGDSVTITGVVSAFSGYGLSNARVALNVTRAAVVNYTSGGSHSILQKERFYSSPQRAEVMRDTIQTDAQGGFEFKFLAAAEDGSQATSLYDFNASASVTDDANETQSASIDLELSKSALRLEASIPEKVFTKNGINAMLTLLNSNKQRQNGIATVKVYALKSPNQFFKSRLWDVPDKWMMSAVDYRKYFPGFAFDHEDEYKNWPQEVMLADLTIALKKDNAGKLEPQELLNAPAGLYAVVINAKNADGDTASVTRYITLITEEATIQKVDDWVVTNATAVKPGMPAEFFVGIGKDCEVLFETFDGPKVLSSQMLQLTAGSPKRIVVLVPKTTDNGFTVQFGLVNGNRKYTYYQRIAVIDTTKPLDIKFLSMRDKLQPGEKEQWKLQVTGGSDTVAAEVLAGMYDASLDKIAPGGSWMRSFSYLSDIPRYFTWEDWALSTAESTEGDTDYYPSNDHYKTNTSINYEELDLLGFDVNQTGNYENYQENIAAIGKKAPGDKRLAVKYKANSVLVKNGYDVVGRVLFMGGGYSGVKVKIYKTNISTLSNSLGYFKIKVPQNAVLIISAKGMLTKKISPPGGTKLILQMKGRLGRLYWDLETADPGPKAQKGDPNADIRIDEPVGNSDVKMVEEENSVYSGQGYMPVSSKRFSPPVVMADKGIMREVTPMHYDERYSVGILQQTGGKANPVTIRQNFNETAFFYPQLRTNTKGQLSIDFTIPESLTSWKFRAFAHNKIQQTGYIEQEVLTRKKMMVTANMPRFLREGDTIMVSARLVNLADEKLKGEAKLEFFDPLTMEPVKVIKQGISSVESFELDTASTKAVSFSLIIPDGLEALTYRITASAGNYTDGEENTLPVLPNAMLITETMPITVRAGQTKNFSFDKLVNQSSSTLTSRSLTLEYTQNPAWTIVQALPYLAEFPYECSEQVFSRFYANNFALGITAKYPQIKKVLDSWRASDSKTMLSALQKNPELKAILLEETPWLKDAADETEQKKNLALLFDLNKMTYELNGNLEKLQKKQLPDGGFPWFGGNYSDRYITQHILAGIGQLKKLNIAKDYNGLLDQITRGVLTYTDKQLKADEADRKKYDRKYQTHNLETIEIHAWYARSYFKHAVDNELAEVQKNYVNRAVTQWSNQPEFEKAMLALTLLRMGEKQAAVAIINSLLETARHSDELGMYWAANKWGYFWNQSPVETQALMVELFNEAGNYPKEIEEMKVWLLRNKQANNWRTTKATAAACYALLVKGSDLLTDTAKVTIVVNGQLLAQLKPGTKADAGSGYLKTSWADEQIKPALGRIVVSNTSKTISWGAMYWQYTEKLDKITSTNTNVMVDRKYFIQKQTDRGPVLTAVDATHLPKTGDLLKIVIHLQADRDFDYIFLKDLRPAGTEPVDALSGYKYQDGLSYYQVTKDVATNFFISRLNKGTYVFEYQLRVVQPGNYATGVTSLQSMYAPEFNAHTQGGRISFEK